MAICTNRRSDSRRSLVYDSAHYGTAIFGVGALERGDPIPPGIYWIDVIYETANNGAEKPDNFMFWVQANRKPAAESDRVTVLRIVQHEERTLPISSPARDWVLFQVHEPVNRWANDAGLGFPSVAEKGTETTEEDTIQSPDLEPFWWERRMLGLPVVVWGIGAVAGTALIITMVRR